MLTCARRRFEYLLIFDYSAGTSQPAVGFFLRESRLD